MQLTYNSVEETAKQIVEQVGKTIVVGLPIGIGKATQFADALFEMASQDSSLSLTIFTGLTLEVPAPAVIWRSASSIR